MGCSNDAIKKEIAKQDVGDFLKSQILAVLRANSTQEKGWYHLSF